MATDDKKSAPKITITTKKPEDKTWLNKQGQTCRKCKWCPGTMILKGT